MGVAYAVAHGRAAVPEGILAVFDWRLIRGVRSFQFSGNSHVDSLVCGFWQYAAVMSSSGHAIHGSGSCMWCDFSAGRPAYVLGVSRLRAFGSKIRGAFPNPLEKLKALLGGGSPPPPPQQLPVQPAAVYPPMQAQLPVQQAPAAPPQEVPQELPQEVPQEVPTDMGGDADDSGDLPGAAAGAATGAGQASQASAGTPPAPGAYCTEPAPPASSQCGSLDECLTIIDRFLDSQPRAFNLLQVRSEDHLEQDLPGPCPEGPAKCRHDTYDSALAALYYVKRGKLSEAREILDAFLGIMYPASLDGFKPPSGETRYTGVASGKTLTLLASSYNSANPPQGGVYENPDVTDGGVDTGAARAGNEPGGSLLAAGAGSERRRELARCGRHAVPVPSGSISSMACAGLRRLGSLRLGVHPVHCSERERRGEGSSLVRERGCHARRARP
ncbi:unnamed protein product [Prorocentrum cordatum]|uniref:Uncharacterized protein n=1 Tax=Prorocentrum cordatum TaxID=2364126 RepID=A0ABN9R8D0_9DINO|nr:unnamed protein product [Polarella glacialis]